MSFIWDKSAKKSEFKWFALNSGGSFRKWYGNIINVVNWYKNGEEIKQTGRAIIPSEDRYFEKVISWNKVSSGSLSVRYQLAGIIPGDASPFLHSQSDDDTMLKYTMAMLNSKVSGVYIQFISPTLNFEVGNIAKLPLLIANLSEVVQLTNKCIDISRKDWDSFETSWDFSSHPLILAEQQMKDNPSSALVDILLSGKHPVKSHGSLDTCYKIWEGQCQQRFDKLKSNEEELNRLFIDIYGLQDELTSDVADKDVTVRKAELGRDIRSLISYAVGCMFGRYSLDMEGMAFAGGEWDDSKYSSFIPDPDNCIPITDEEYFSDDIVGRFVEFIRVVYGPETLEENLDFVASALGNKGNSSREVIRNYFLNDFYKDHLKIYQKRPIYWLFDSGKQNGFKALVYMHRWNADTVGNLRIEYLHKMQNVYEHEIETCQDMIDHGSGRDVAVATKRKEKLVKQLKECKDYDALVAHIAFSKIDIDLDDGVKVNYRKVQIGADGKLCEILANSKDIMAKEK